MAEESIWSSLPTVLTAIGGVLTAAATLVGALYSAGITASMEQNGIAAGAITTFLGQASVGLTTGTYRGLDAIRVQRWIALYMNGPEAFSDLRRYGWDWTTDAGKGGS